MDNQWLVERYHCADERWYVVADGLCQEDAVRGAEERVAAAQRSGVMIAAALVAEGMPETKAAQLVGLNRMTVRKTLGK